MSWYLNTFRSQLDILGQNVEGILNKKVAYHANQESLTDKIVNST